MAHPRCDTLPRIAYRHFRCRGGGLKRPNRAKELPGVTHLPASLIGTSEAEDESRSGSPGQWRSWTTRRAMAILAMPRLGQDAYRR